jgi:hypothetical protein
VNPSQSGAIRDVDINRVYRIAASLLDNTERRDTSTVKAIYDEAVREGADHLLVYAFAFEYCQALGQVHGPDVKRWLDLQIIRPMIEGPADAAQE